MIVMSDATNLRWKKGGVFQVHPHNHFSLTYELEDTHGMNIPDLGK